MENGNHTIHRNYIEIKDLSWWKPPAPSKPLLKLYNFYDQELFPLGSYPDYLLIDKSSRYLINS